MSSAIMRFGIVVVAILLARSSLFAIALEFVPPTQNVSLGSTAEVAIKITDLGNLTAPSLGTYDIDVNFNSAILSLNSVTFGDPVLGDQLDLFGLGSLALATPSSVSINLFELSFDSVDDLNNLQAADFILARLLFDTAGAGISALTFKINALGDALGDPLTASVQDSSVTVTGVAVVPEPSSLSLLLLGTLLLARSAFRWRQ